MDNYIDSKPVYENGQIPKNVNARKLKSCLKPELVTISLAQQVARFQKAVQDATPHLKSKGPTITLQSPDRIKPLPEGVQEKNDEKGWQYTYDPFELLTREFESLIHELKLNPKDNPVQAIHRIWQILCAHQGNNVSRLVREYLHIPVEKSPRDYECDPKTEAGRLFAKNKEISEKSDVFVDFDHKRLHISRHKIPLPSLLNPGLRPSSDVLRERAHARDLIMKRLGEGPVMVGTIRIYLNDFGVIVAESDSVPQWLVNMLGQNVFAAGVIIEPEKQAIREAALVRGYGSLEKQQQLKVPFHPYVEEITQTYVFSDEMGPRTPDLIAYCVRHALVLYPCQCPGLDDSFS